MYSIANSPQLPCSSNAPCMTGKIGMRKIERSRRTLLRQLSRPEYRLRQLGHARCRQFEDRPAAPSVTQYAQCHVIPQVSRIGKYRIHLHAWCARTRFRAVVIAEKKHYICLVWQMSDRCCTKTRRKEGLSWSWILWIRGFGMKVLRYRFSGTWKK